MNRFFALIVGVDSETVGILFCNRENSTPCGPKTESRHGGVLDVKNSLWPNARFSCFSKKRSPIDKYGHDRFRMEKIVIF